jgi:hypothetical protein
LEKTIFLVKKELKKLMETRLGIVQLHRAKRQAIGQLAINYQAGINEMLGIAKSHLYKPLIRTSEEIIAEIERIDAKELLEISNEIFDEKKLSMLIFKGKKDEKSD